MHIYEMKDETSQVFVYARYEWVCVLDELE
ncbi:MAG: hypothetical protein ACI90V_004331, partial [Bacillariaceae sp.]|jgi:hypothetical protein